MEVTLLMPCLNEEKSLPVCIQKAQDFLRDNRVSGEVLIADNGSRDRSRDIAADMGARVVEVPRQGYGAALMAGIASARGRYVIMADADGSYDFAAAMPFVEKLREGYDLVMGNRFKGGIKPGAMPFLHRYLGNPVLSGIARLFFRSSITDFHCGMRGFNRAAIISLQLNAPGMEFASEMVAKATLVNLRICEVPVVLYPDLRGHPSHLRTWRDGWRHLRFILLLSPNWVFIYPGAVLMTVSFLLGLRLWWGPLRLGDIVLDVHTMMYCALGVFIGFQALAFGTSMRFLAVRERVLPIRRLDRKLIQMARLERGLIFGAVVLLAGAVGSINAVLGWKHLEFGALDPRVTLRIVIPCVVTIFLGAHIIMTTLFLSMLVFETPEAATED